MGGPPTERVSGILVGMVREMTEVNRDLAHQVAELRQEHRARGEVLQAIKTRLDADAKVELDRVNTHSAVYRTVMAIVRLPGLPLGTVVLALWLAKVLGVISFLGEGIR